MAKEIDRYFVVKVRIAGEMLNDSSTTYDTEAAALKRANALASEGEYAEVRERVITERLTKRVEPCN